MANITATPTSPNPDQTDVLAAIRISNLTAITNPTALVMTFLESPLIAKKRVKRRHQTAFGGYDQRV
jgi:hypothetical protein